MTALQEYKRKEFIGDAVLNLLVREMVSDWTDRSKQRGDLFEITTNKVLSEIAKRIGIEPAPFDTGKRNKLYANAIEVRLYELYSEQGMDEARQYFIETMIPMFRTVMADKKELNYRIINN